MERRNTPAAEVYRGRVFATGNEGERRDHSGNEHLQ